MDVDSCRTAGETVQMPDQVIGGGSVTDGGMEGGAWRTTLQQDARQRIVNKIMEMLKRHLPFTGQEGLQELKKIAVRFEEKIYTGATSQSDYLRKISLKMLTMETKSQNPMANSLESNAATNGENPHDPDSSSQIGSATDEDWQEEIYQKIKSMHGMYYPELNDMYQRVAARLQQHDDAHPQQPSNEPLEKLRLLKLILERLIMFLQTKKNDILPYHKDKIGGVEKQIVKILNSNRPRKAISSMQQGQLPQPHMHAMQQPQVSQTHTSEAQMNSQMQQMNILGSSLPTQQNNSTILQQNTITSGSYISDSRQNDVVMKQNPLGGSQPITTSSVTSTNGQSNPNFLESISSILRQQENQQWQFNLLQRQQQLQGEQIIQQQQLIQQFMQQQQQTSQVQPAQLHAQQQHMQSQPPLLQQMPSLPQKEQQLQPQKTFPLQSGLAQHMQVVLQQLQLQQTSQQQSRQVTGQQPVTPQELLVIHQQFIGQDLEKQLLIPKHQTSQKQPGDPIVFFILVFSLLILLLVKFFLLEVFRTHQLSSE